MNPAITPPLSSTGSPSVQSTTAIVQVFGGQPFHADGELLTLAFAADGTLWSIEEPGVLRHWDPARQQQLGWQDLNDPAMLWCFRPDAALLASASDEVVLWDVSGALERDRLEQPSWVTSLAFAPEAALLATGHEDGVVRLWDLAGRRLVHELIGHRQPVSALAFSREGTRLASAGEDKLIHLWDASRGTRQGTLRGHTDRIPALVWQPGGQRLYSAGWDTTVRVWDTRTLEPIILLNSHAPQVTALVLNPAGTLLAAADSANTLHLWAVPAHRTVRICRGHEAEVRTLAFSPDGKCLASGGADQVIRLWLDLEHEGNAPETTSSSSVLPETRSGEEHAGVTASPDGKRLLSTGGGTVLHVWDTSSARPLVDLEDVTELDAVAWSPDGRWIAGSAASAPPRLWEAATGRCWRTLSGQKPPVTALAFSADSQVLASGSPRGTDVWLWNVATGEAALLIPDAADGCSIEALAFHPRERLLAVGGIDWLATGGSDGAVTVWDTDHSRRVVFLDGGVVALAFHPAGDLLATASLYQSILIWNVSTWRDAIGQPQPVAELVGHRDGVTCLAYSPDGVWLASGGADRTIRLWDAAGGILKGELQLDTQVKALCFSPDGRYLFTGNGNTSCYQVDVRRLLGG